MSLAADLRSFVINNFLLGRQEALNDDDSFLEQGIIDSTGILELVAHLEETYGIAEQPKRDPHFQDAKGPKGRQPGDADEHILAAGVDAAGLFVDGVSAVEQSCVERPREISCPSA